MTQSCLLPDAVVKDFDVFCDLVPRLLFSVNNTTQYRWPLNPFDSTLDDLPQYFSSLLSPVPIITKANFPMRKMSCC